MSSTLATQRLALGIEVQDFLRRRPVRGLDVAIERPLSTGYAPSAWPKGSGRSRPDGLVRLAPHASGRHILLRPVRFASPITVRITDPQLRFAPRKLRFNIPPGPPITKVASVHPAAAYPITKHATSIRGRVVDAGGAPVRWAFVEARRAVANPGAGVQVGVAHGGDDGEFLLVVEPDLLGVGGLPEQADVELTAYGPASVPVVPPGVPGRDLIWDLPVYDIPGGATPTNTRLAGYERPASYSISGRVTATLDVGFVRTGVTVPINP